MTLLWKKEKKDRFLVVYAIGHLRRMRGCGPRMWIRGGSHVATGSFGQWATLPSTLGITFSSLSSVLS